MASKYISCAQNYLNKLIALQKPIVYNTKVAVEVAKQVYKKEGMAFPTGAQFSEAQQTLQNNLKISNLKNLTSADVVKGGVVLAEIYTFFLIGEIVGRRNLVGYNVKSEDHHEH
ncbi:mitochondrial ATP synthase g subunit-domain-containing protein [Cokeromyces recurvatus]|uniref:mitochondrial ATP synthase g subunit-domain-containing protein n=1 Tax=Cokeromyces recurvatus TaxID=90255 RepID=UPI002220FE47|nr:mitochondrial ATP synthase g subunit-domain-containing protein [Cokeromyces recurvatus]KAI7905693.1 mitochondrial ATP synthase g subunit-domain-containing protein [Cokeromyces recurvatus]